MHDHIFITLLMMCQLLKYNKTIIIIITISFFLTRLLWNSVVQDQCRI